MTNHGPKIFAQSRVWPFCRLALIVLGFLLIMGLGPLAARESNPKTPPDPLELLLQRQTEARDKELNKIEKLRHTIESLDQSIDQSENGLDTMLIILRERKVLIGLEDQFKKNEADRKAQYEKLYEQQKEKDIQKFRQIIASPYGQDLKEAARNSLIRKYPGLNQQVSNWDASLGPDPEKLIRMTNTLGMEFIFLPPGRFRMGSPNTESHRDPDEIQHEVEISNGFYMQVTEVTQGQWQAVMKENPSNFKACGKKCPVESVSYAQSLAFIKRLNILEKTTKYSLPTESQWEYAARAGTQTALSNGKLKTPGCALVPSLDSISWYCGNAERRTHPVRKRKPNPWGLYDMHGNVWEWCTDWYGPYPTGLVIDPKGPLKGRTQVIRGGSWLHNPSHLRSANRFFQKPSFKGRYLGLRLIRRP